MDTITDSGSTNDSNNTPINRKTKITDMMTANICDWSWSSSRTKRAPLSQR